MTARRRPRAPDAAALAAEVERQGAVIVELVAIVDALAVRQIETAEDVREMAEDMRELRALMRAKGKAPPAGTVALKTAVALTGMNYETARRWCARGIVHAEWVGRRWCVSPPLLAAELAKRRKAAA
jgi:hypothetical protein